MTSTAIPGRSKRSATEGMTAYRSGVSHASSEGRKKSGGRGNRKPGSDRIDSRSNYMSRSATETTIRERTSSRAARHKIHSASLTEGSANTYNILRDKMRQKVSLSEMKTEEPTPGGAAATKPSNHISFENIFADLQRFKEENGTLFVPVSHPSFGCIVDALSSAGMELLMKKRWEDQLASLVTFKRAHGDCLIPDAHPTLGGWARIQCDHYKLYEQQSPCPLTKKRFDKLKSVGFGKYVQWEETNKNSGDTKPQVQLKRNKAVKKGKENDGNAKTAKQINVVASEAKGVLTSEGKVQERNKISSSKSKDPKQNVDAEEEMAHKVVGATELFQRRMIKRSLRRGLGRERSKRLLISETTAETGEEGCANEEDDARQNLSRCSGLVRSCSASNLCPGSWECKRCAYVNEPVGLDSRESCGVCDESREGRRWSTPSSSKASGVLARQESMQLGDMVARRISKCDIDVGVTSWSELVDVLEVAAILSKEEQESELHLSCRGA